MLTAHFILILLNASKKRETDIAVTLLLNMVLSLKTKGTLFDKIKIIEKNLTKQNTSHKVTHTRKLLLEIILVEININKDESKKSMKHPKYRVEFFVLHCDLFACNFQKNLYTAPEITDHFVLFLDSKLGFVVSFSDSKYLIIIILTRIIPNIHQLSIWILYYLVSIVLIVTSVCELIVCGRVMK